MIGQVKRILITLLCVGVLCSSYSCHRPDGKYNPYLHDKVKVSARELKKQTKADRKARKAYNKQTRRTSMRLYGRKPGPKKKAE